MERRRDRRSCAGGVGDSRVARRRGATTSMARSCGRGSRRAAVVSMSAASRRSVKSISLESEWVAGVDGCRSGWLVILCALAPRESMPLHITSRLCTDFQAVLDLTERPIAVAVDMPIGLLERAAPGGRGCDREARAVLGRPRSGSVFSPPTRPGLAALKYEDAARANGAGMSKESFNIL